VDATIVVAVLAGTVTAIGWVVDHRLSERRELTRIAIEAQLRHIESQLEDLYGPLVFYLHEGEQAFEDLRATIGQDGVLYIEDGELTDPIVSTWLYWAENVFMPRNEAIVQLLKTKAHLVDGPTFPASYVEMIHHHHSWMIRHRRWRDEAVRYSWRSNIEWPADFQVDVPQTFEGLKQRQAELLQKLS
jgi:hypothetical protein